MYYKLSIVNCYVNFVDTCVFVKLMKFTYSTLPQNKYCTYILGTKCGNLSIFMDIQKYCSPFSMR